MNSPHKKVETELNQTHIWPHYMLTGLHRRITGDITYISMCIKMSHHTQTLSEKLQGGGGRQQSSDLHAYLYMLYYY